MWNPWLTTHARFVPMWPSPRAPHGEEGDGGVALETVSVAVTQYAVTIPLPQEEPFIEIRLLPGHELVTVIEVLSPSNKRDGADGRQEYLKKRNEIPRSKVHLVEIDLLRGGLRPPTDQPLKVGTDYCVLIHRAPERPFAKAHEWTLRDRLPVVPIPLGNGDPDASLDLQAALERIYERGGYDYLLDYGQPLTPPLPAGHAAWASKTLDAARKR